jgi:general secretion pathway protein N
MLSRYSWLALGVGAYLAFVVITFPASVAYRWFAPETVKLAGIEGTLWSGRSAIGSVSNFPLRDIEWRVRPWSLLLARVNGELQTRLTDGFITTDFEATFSQTRLRNLNASTSLSGVRDLLPLAGIEGFVSAQFSDLRIEDNFPEVAIGEVRLGELSVPPLLSPGSSSLIELGNYQIQFVETPDASLLANIVDQGGPMETSGSLRLDQQRAYTIDGTVRSRPDASLELTRGLDMMAAPPDNEGKRAFTLTGSL